MLKGHQILNRAIVPDLQATLIDQMKSSYISIATDGSNNQGLQKIRLFYIYVSIKANYSYWYFQCH